MSAVIIGAIYLDMVCLWWKALKLTLDWKFKTQTATEFLKISPTTVEYHYNVVQYCKMLHEWLQAPRQNINQMVDLEKNTHTSP